MSEDRTKHDRAGTEVPVGRRLGRPQSSRAAEGQQGMSQHIPDRVRAKVEGKDARTAKGKGGK